MDEHLEKMKLLKDAHQDAHEDAHRNYLIYIIYIEDAQRCSSLGVEGS
jgi:hypothetical protein